jgi:gas vesicle protein
MNAKDCAAYVAVFTSGALVGGLGALLLAPDSGPETRKRIARRFEDEKREAMRKGQRMVEETAERLEHGIEDGKRRLSAALRS